MNLIKYIFNYNNYKYIKIYDVFLRENSSMYDSL